MVEIPHCEHCNDAKCFSLFDITHPVQGDPWPFPGKRIRKTQIAGQGRRGWRRIHRQYKVMTSHVVKTKELAR